MPLAIARLVSVFCVCTVVAGFCLLIILSCPSIFSQSTTEGSIAGTLADPSGAAIADAQIVASNAPSDSDYKTTSDASGNFRFAGLPPGVYRVEVRLAPYSPYLAEAVQVEVGRVTTLSPRLALDSRKETVVVEEKSPGLDTTSAAISTNLDQDAIHGLPSNGRRWSNFALLTPTVVPDQQGNGLLSFRGISVLLNNNTMDGADNNQAFFLKNGVGRASAIQRVKRRCASFR